MVRRGTHAPLLECCSLQAVRIGRQVDLSFYAWASREDISPLTQLLDSVASGTALYIRSGGALAVSAPSTAVAICAMVALAWLYRDAASRSLPAVSLPDTFCKPF